MVEWTKKLGTHRFTKQQNLVHSKYVYLYVRFYCVECSVIELNEESCRFITSKSYENQWHDWIHHYSIGWVLIAPWERYMPHYCADSWFKTQRKLTSALTGWLEGVFDVCMQTCKHTCMCEVFEWTAARAMRSITSKCVHISPQHDCATGNLLKFAIFCFYCDIHNFSAVSLNVHSTNCLLM